MSLLFSVPLGRAPQVYEPWMNGWAELLMSFLGNSPPRWRLSGPAASKKPEEAARARRSRTTRAEPSQTGRASALVWPNQSYEKFVAKTRLCAECAQAGIFQAVSRTIVRTLAGFELVATGQESFGKFSPPAAR
jgi:hypothetical protein